MVIISMDGATVVGLCKKLFDEKMHWFRESMRANSLNWKHCLCLSDTEELQAGGWHQCPLALSRGPLPGHRLVG